jgi:NAD+ synthase (glutamine-hydrolysing)
MLDAIIQAYMEERRIAARNHRPGFCRSGCAHRGDRVLKRNEYKRSQAPPGVRVTQRGFGKDWRYPITSRYRDA